MSDREQAPTDLFDVICSLDDLAEWLEPTYPDQADRLKDLSWELKDCLVIRMKEAPREP